MYGLAPLKEFWEGLSPTQRKSLGEPLKNELKVDASARDLFYAAVRNRWPGASVASIKLRAFDLYTDQEREETEEMDFSPELKDPFEAA